MQHLKQTIELLKNSQYYYTIIIGMDSLYSYVSPSYDKNFSVLSDSLVGKPFHITLHPDDIKICSETGNQCFEKPEILHMATLRKHDGKGGYVSTQWELKALFGEDNTPAGIFGIGHNISEYVDTRNQLESAENLILHKSDQLNQIGFMQSHFIRKPLANILGLIQVLEDIEVPPELQHIKSMLVDCSAELDHVIQVIIKKSDE